LEAVRARSAGSGAVDEGDSASSVEGPGPTAVADRIPADRAACAAEADTALRRPALADGDATTCATKSCHALVIGNANYSIGPLQPDTLEEATRAGQSLTGFGFSVSLALDVKRQQLRGVVKDFVKTLGRDSVSVVLFVGRGTSSNGSSYVLPVDYAAKRGAKSKDDGKLSVAALLKSVARRHVAANVFIADCTRSFGRASATSPHTGVYASGCSVALAPPSGALVAFSTSPGEADGQTDNTAPSTCSYVSELVGKLEEHPGLLFEQVLKRVRRHVANVTGGRQVPWEASALTVDFVLNSGGTGSKTANGLAA